MWTYQYYKWHMVVILALLHWGPGPVFPLSTALYCRPYLVTIRRLKVYNLSVNVVNDESPAIHRRAQLAVCVNQRSFADKIRTSVLGYSGLRDKCTCVVSSPDLDLGPLLIPYNLDHCTEDPVTHFPQDLHQSPVQ